METPQRLVSVGIDVGTTTTQLVFSELALVAIARAGQIPRLDIADRAVLHESEIVFTPFSDGETIDSEALAAILRAEYQKAGIAPSQVETGAVIITGETARKKNAQGVLAAIAGLAGDFVVTVAGPNVEGMIAGRGSGTAAYSRQHFCTAVNLDIGGGSANAAVFRAGQLVSSSAMNFGGRVMELDGPVLRSVTNAGQAILDAAGLHLVPGDRPTLAQLRKACDIMAGLTVELLEGRTSALADKLYQCPPLPGGPRPKQVMFSGGIGYYYYEPARIACVEDVAVHGDVGPLLARSLLEEPALASYSVIRPQETRRATVLGASAQSLTLSGSTIWADPSILPLKNLPVVRPADSSSIAQAVRRWDLDPGADQYAVALDVEGGMDYAQLEGHASQVADFARSLPEGKPVVIITRRDYAQALGLAIKGREPGRPLLVIDQVGLEEGDYIDIGSPLMDGRVVPLVVKTLIFYH
jgi:ethanolamine utilization protein EutA